jgi:nucleoside triphosphate pyrophosphatase
MKLILASGSHARRSLLENAGLAFEVVPAALDERAAEQPLIEAGATPEDLAMALAMAKASMVSEAHPGALVIGADQTLELEGERLTKPADMEAARHQLLMLSGRTHTLHSAVAGAREGAIVWQHVEAAHMTMRRLTPKIIGRYLAAVGPDALASVGAYQIERRGIQLFEKLEGDYFAVLGLPILPLLAFLRSEGIVE